MYEFLFVYLCFVLYVLDIYVKVLTLVAAKLSGVKVLAIKTDYETALINALQRCFPGVRTSGCWFHQCQSLFRYVFGVCMCVCVHLLYLRLFVLVTKSDTTLEAPSKPITSTTSGSFT